MPEVHEARLAHWTLVATGDIGAAFDESVERLADQAAKLDRAMVALMAHEKAA